MAERRLVEPHVAGSTPVTHPIYPLIKIYKELIAGYLKKDATNYWLTVTLSPGVGSKWQKWEVAAAGS